MTSKLEELIDERWSNEKRDLSIGGETFFNEIVRGQDASAGAFGEVTFYNINFDDMSFGGTYFINCIFEDCKFHDTSFHKCLFWDNTFKNCQFEYCFFPNAGATYGKFENVIFKNCHVPGIVFRECSISKSKFINTDLTKIISNNVRIRQRDRWIESERDNDLFIECLKTMSEESY